MEKDMKSARAKNIDYLVNLIGVNFKIKQYNRLLKDKLFPEEDFDVVSDELMEYFIGLEEYEKCGEIKRIKTEKKLISWISDNN